MKFASHPVKDPWVVDARRTNRTYCPFHAAIVSHVPRDVDVYDSDRQLLSSDAGQGERGSYQRRKYCQIKTIRPGNEDERGTSGDSQAEYKNVKAWAPSGRMLKLHRDSVPRSVSTKQHIDNATAWAGIPFFLFSFFFLPIDEISLFSSVTLLLKKKRVTSLPIIAT